MGEEFLLDSSGSGQGQGMDCFEQNHEPSDFLKDGKFC